MFCPRCGRAINENANFCGGCGLSRAEIEKYINATATQEQPAEPAVSEPVGCEPVVTETPAEEAPVTETVVEPVAEEPKTETTYSYTAPEGAEYHYTAQTNPANSSSQPSYSYAQPVEEPAKPTAECNAEKPAKNENLSTVDFIWMMLISSIPLVGLIYIIYLAIQNNNTNKRSYARATLIISLFAAIVGIVFALGFMISGL